MAGSAPDTYLRQESQNDVLGGDAWVKRPLNIDSISSGLNLQQALAGQYVFDFAGAYSERKRAECPMSRSVTVTAHDGHSRLGEAQLRPDYMDDAAVAAMHSQKLDAEIAGVLLHLSDLRRRHLVEYGHVEGSGWDAVVDGRHGLLRSTHSYSPFAQPRKSLWGSDLVDEMQIDVKHCRAAGALGDDVLIPNFIDDCSR